MGSPEAAPIPLQSVLANQNAVFIGFGQAARWTCILAQTELRDSL